MSSTYRIICLSHDPAIVFGGEDERGVSWSTPEQALEAVRNRSDGPARAHPNCDLVVGRYSYPLIEVCCPARRAHPRGFHTTDNWIDVAWLRLLALSTPELIDQARMPRSCWTRDLAIALRLELDIEETA